MTSPTTSVPTASPARPRNSSSCVREWKLLKGRDHVVVEANLLLEQVARRQGVTWINLYPLFADENGRLRSELTNDGLHLMGEGYLIWRDAIRPYIK